MNYREQAHKAVAETARSAPVINVPAHVRLADAASNVWEPLTRELYEMLRDSTPGPITEDMPITQLLRKAKEALG